MAFYLFFILSFQVKQKKQKLELIVLVFFEIDIIRILEENSGNISFDYYYLFNVDFNWNLYLPSRRFLEEKNKYSGRLFVVSKCQ